MQIPPDVSIIFMTDAGCRQTADCDKSCKSSQRRKQNGFAILRLRGFAVNLQRTKPAVTPFYCSNSARRECKLFLNVSILFYKLYVMAM
jgi:Fe-S-cluster-containing hydrogenase component 2